MQHAQRKLLSNCLIHRSNRDQQGKTCAGPTRKLLRHFAHSAPHCLYLVDSLARKMNLWRRRGPSHRCWLLEVFGATSEKSLLEPPTCSTLVAARRRPAPDCVHPPKRRVAQQRAAQPSGRGLDKICSGAAGLVDPAAAFATDTVGSSSDGWGFWFCWRGGAPPEVMAQFLCVCVVAVLCAQCYGRPRIFR